MLARASICSVTRIVPSSAAMALPTRPASIVAASTGPSSRTSDMLITAPNRVSMLQLAELGVALHRQHHADEGAGQGHHRQAQHADLIEVRHERLAARQPGEKPLERPQAEQGDAPQAGDVVHHHLSEVGNPVGHPVGCAGGPGRLGVDRDWSEPEDMTRGQGQGTGG